MCSSGDEHAYRTGPNSIIDPGDDLGTLGGSSSNAYAINDAGQVTGTSLPATGVEGHAFRTAANGGITMTSDLGTLGGPALNSWGFGINTSGQVVGQSATVGNTSIHAFRTTATGGITADTDLGPLGGGSSYAYGINRLGTDGWGFHRPRERSLARLPHDCDRRHYARKRSRQLHGHFELCPRHQRRGAGRWIVLHRTA